MAEDADAFNGVFQMPGGAALPPEVLGELQSTARLHSLSAQELFFKWESYCLKMGAAETKLGLDSARAFKKDTLEALERESRQRAHGSTTHDRRSTYATPRAGLAADDVFGMLDGVNPKTPASRAMHGSSKRKSTFETSSSSKSGRANGRSSPSDGRMSKQDSNGLVAAPFADRQHAGQTVETLNDQLAPFEPPLAPFSESRIRLKANTDIPKFSYKPLAMHQSEASEVLDDRIDDFTAIIQKKYNLEDAAFGNPASESTSQIVATGRIASDTPESKLNAASIVLETSRRTGAGLRVPLKFGSEDSRELFPGQMIAVRGTNASGEYFQVDSVLEPPLPPPVACKPAAFELLNQRLGIEADAATATDALNIMVSAGPYTSDSNLDFEPLRELCDKAIETSADALLLIGPFIDIEHPMVALGDFDLPDDSSLEPDKATLADVFRLLISSHLKRVAQALPAIHILLVPSTRDAINKHVSWPQDIFARKELALPKQAKCLPNPVLITMNELVFGISAQDILNDLRLETVNIGKPREQNLLARLPRHLIQQAHFYPLFPPIQRANLPAPSLEGAVATGTPLDISYLKLAEWSNVRPDVLILPSALPPFAKVVESVLVVNPGPLSKKKAAGTFARMTVHPQRLTDEERAASDELVSNRLFERARVDVIRI